ncbi:MAG TPA: amino acid ABC transporter substrate-binding protein [Gammaproteobacteria bacterium]|nr:amino acid ABC transporter substrate-binding protein [Gammaproteobacteria bacterium]
MKTFRLLLSLLLLLSVQLASAAAPGVPPTLKIGTTAAYQPLTFKADNKLQGMEIDLGKAVGETLKIRTRFVVLPREELIPALESGKIDVIMSGMSVTDQRAAQVLFTNPYMKIGQMALIRTDDLLRWSRPEALFTPGARVGVTANTTGAAFAKSKLPDAVITRFDNTDAGVDALEAGKIDIFIHDAPTIWRLTANMATQKADLMGLYRPLTDEHLAWAVKKQNTGLANALNGALEILKQNGTLNLIMGRWIPVQVKINPR